MKTRKLYSYDSYLASHEARIIAMSPHPDGIRCILDQTVAYPQGGGQPSDSGMIEVDHLQLGFDKVQWIEGDICHLLSANLSNIDQFIGQTCSVHIDPVKRLHHAQLHSGGHLLDDVIKTRFPELQVIKGHHFPQEAYVSCSGEISDLPTFLHTINDALNQEIQKKRKFCQQELTGQKAKDIIASLPYPVPPSPSLRVIQLAGSSPVPCGGTHVRSTEELMGLQVSKVKKKSGLYKLSYQLALLKK